MIGIIGGTVAVAGFGAWLRWGITPALAAYKAGRAIGRMQAARRP